MWSFWLIAAGVFFVFEICTSGFLIFWLGLASLLSMVASFFTTNLIIQTIIFIVSSTLLILLTKPLLDKFLKSETNNLTPTNIYSVIGKKGIVLEDINNIDYTGKVKVAGELWSAISDEDLVKGTHVEVTEVNGVKLKVKPIKEFSATH